MARPGGKVEFGRQGIVEANHQHTRLDDPQNALVVGFWEVKRSESRRSLLFFLLHCYLSFLFISIRCSITSIYLLSLFITSSIFPFFLLFIPSLIFLYPVSRSQVLSFRPSIPSSFSLAIFLHRLVLLSLPFLYAHLIHLPFLVPLPLHCLCFLPLLSLFNSSSFVPCPTFSDFLFSPTLSFLPSSFVPLHRHFLFLLPLSYPSFFIPSSAFSSFPFPYSCSSSSVLFLCLSYPL